jgi:hypothetical protein
MIALPSYSIRLFRNYSKPNLRLAFCASAWEINRAGRALGSTVARSERIACQAARGKSRNHRMGLIILIVLILLLVGAFPTRGYGFGYGSHGLIGTILIIVLILYLLGHFR